MLLITTYYVGSGLCLCMGLCPDIRDRRETDVCIVRVQRVAPSLRSSATPEEFQQSQGHSYKPMLFLPKV